MTDMTLLNLGNNNGQNRSSNMGRDIPLRSSLEQYRLVILCVRGNVSVIQTMRAVREMLLANDSLPVLVLGPTAPEDMANGHDTRIGWITFVDGNSQAHPSPAVQVISPDNLLEVNLFIDKAIQGEGSCVIIGDFLDNVMRSTDSPGALYSFICQLASRIRLKRRTAILLLKEDIHDKPMIEVVKRFADIVLEFRDQETDGQLRVEMRTLNFADNVYSGWMPFPEGLIPLSTTS